MKRLRDSIAAIESGEASLKVLRLGSGQASTPSSVTMGFVISFLIAVATGVACHYIIKWLDSDHKGNK